jgi:uncharacterized protein YdaL
MRAFIWIRSISIFCAVVSLSMTTTARAQANDYAAEVAQFNSS